MCQVLRRTLPRPLDTFSPPSPAVLFLTAPLYPLSAPAKGKRLLVPACALTLRELHVFPHAIPPVNCCPLPVIWGSCHPPVFLKQEHGPCHVVGAGREGICEPGRNRPQCPHATASIKVRMPQWPSVFPLVPELA